MRKYLVEEKKLLSPTLIPSEIHVRSTDVNRTIDSALCHLQGLYPNGNPFELEANQVDILPPFGISETLLKET